MATALIGQGVKALAKSVGSGTASKAGGMVFDFALGLAGVDNTSAKLDEIKAAIAALSSKLDGISSELKTVSLTFTTQLAGEHMDSIETLFTDYTRDLLELAEHATEKTSIEPGTDKTHWQKAHDALVETGKTIKSQVPKNLARIHHLLVGETGAKSLLLQARETDRPTSKSFVNHYIYMRQVFLKYYVVQVKGITLLQWISAPKSGVDFFGGDSGTTKGAISISQDYLVEQEKAFNNLIGPQIVRMCRLLIDTPFAGAWTRIYSEADSPWDWLHYPRLKKDNHDDRLRIELGGSVGLATWMGDASLIPVVMLTSDELKRTDDIGKWRYAPKDCIWKIDPIGFDENSKFAVNGDYKFSIRPWHFDGVADEYLHFGGSVIVKDFAVLSQHQDYSVWRVTANEKPDYLNFQFAKDGWPENGWCLNCSWGKASWLENGEHVRGGALAKAANQDGADSYQRFRVNNEPDKPMADDDDPILT